MFMLSIDSLGCQKSLTFSLKKYRPAALPACTARFAANTLIWPAAGKAREGQALPCPSILNLTLPTSSRRWPSGTLLTMTLLAQLRRAPTSPLSDEALELLRNVERNARVQGDMAVVAVRGWFVQDPHHPTDLPSRACFSGPLSRSHKSS